MRNTRPGRTALGIIGWAFVLGGAMVMADQPAASPGPAKLSSLGGRIFNYGKFQEGGWAHLRAIGLKYVFIATPAPDEVAAVQKRLADNGLKVAVMRGNADLTTDASVAGLATQLAVCRKMGVHYMFLSPKHPGVSKEDACRRLRRAGELAKPYGVTLVLETHPDLGTNAAEHVATMKRINHPNVRVNFDTGNITFYNKGLNAVDELKKVMPYVATMEIKDHNGQFNVWNFPALGKGVVDIPGVLKVMQQHGFTGPITMEVEGVQGSPWTEAETKQNIADSAKYMHSLGKFR
jgi:L-ribulose-5-phosphate 3-epimerase